MKRLLIVLILLFSTSASWAGGIIQPMSVISPDCPSRTYVAYWDGDHSSGSTVMCVDSGNSTSTGTQTGGDLGASYGESGSVGFRADAADERLMWDSLGNSFVNETEAVTIWMRVAITQITTLNQTPFFEFLPVSGKVNAIYTQLMTTQYLRGYWVGNSAADDVQSPTQPVVDGTWLTVGISVRADAGTYAEDFAITIDGGTTWFAQNDDPVSMTADLTRFLIGNYEITSLGDDQVDITKFEIIQGWKVTCPW